MSDTSHHHTRTPDPVEGDGVAYRSIGWFLVILVLTVAASQLVVWGAYEFFNYRVTQADPPRALMAHPLGTPGLVEGRVVSGGESSQTPPLLVNEPTVLRDFNQRQDELLHTYGWVDQTQTAVRLPIETAKELVLERGLPVRP